MSDSNLSIDGIGLSQFSEQYGNRWDRTLHDRVSNALQYLARQGSLPFESLNTNRFDVGLNAETHEMVVRVLDRKSGEVLYQIPTKAVLRMAAEARHAASKTGAGGE